MIRVLLVDDDVSITELLELRLTGRGFSVVSCNTADEALRLVASQEFDCVVTDLNMAGMNGLELCERLVENRPGLPVIVMTAHTALDNAVAALRAGATDFLTKPIDLNALEFAIERATTQRRLTTELRRLQTGGPAALPRFEELIGESPAMKKLFDLLGRVAEIEASVLIVGESGTGKERVAHALHRRSRRATKPFVAINCAAVPEHLLESELFGHVRGAFTDAKTDHVGLFQQAHGGTLFLDEVGELPLRLQPKLLRALQERTVRAVGGTREIPCDIRLVAATNRDLDRLVYEGHFREDLYYRINVIQIKVPPLRNREGDVALFAQHFLERYAHQSKKAVRGFAPAALAKLSGYNWPGNVRELQNSIESAVAMTSFDQLTVDDLPERIQSYRAPAVVLSPTESVDLLPLEEVERRHMQRVLAACGGNKTLAAKILKVNRRTLGRKFGVDSQTEGDDSGSSNE